MDDTVIHSPGLESPNDKKDTGHFKHLDMVLGAYVKANVKLEPNKCDFFKARVSFLGHEVDAQGI